MVNQNSSIIKVDTSDITNAIFSFKGAVESALKNFKSATDQKKIVLKTR